MSINPTSAQLNDFIQKDDGKPFVMINLLKFKTSSDPDEKPGQDAYNRYMQNVAPFLAKVGGRLVWMGDVKHVFIGLSDHYWDRVLLVEYPSRTAFLEMISTEEYKKVHQDRESGLETSALLVSQSMKYAM